eukprot:gnl/TRDRNA2_/TRDRNA2_194802_c0_seq1.p1 gnl/TRDRNA2_/TRDRNA2_194802_c0~~gnl/TRDRNA2_/TRDRNA2_194802_c0_seq1.p1  ORF type:complete len:398 (+),score=63.96 gnl/TRDRNA2_/TRDRNA2_194802_c0_seq1:53-1195(+)
MAGGVPNGLPHELVPVDQATKHAAAPVWAPKCKVTDDDLQKTHNAIRAVACTKDTIITGSAKPDLKVWKVAESKVTYSFQMSNGAVGMSCVEVAGDNNLVAACADDGLLGMWDMRQKHKVGSLESSNPGAANWKLKFLRDDRRLVTGGPAGTLAIWDLRASRMEAEVQPSTSSSVPKEEETRVKRQRGDDGAPAGSKRRSPVYSIAVSNDGNYIGCGRGTGEVGVLRLEDLEWTTEVKAHRSEDSVAPVRGLAFETASRQLLSGGDDYHVCILASSAWLSDAAQAWHGIERFPAHRGWVTSVDVCPEPTRRIAVTTSWDSTVKLWDIGSRMLLRTYKEHADSVCAAAFAPAGTSSHFFVTVGADAALNLYAVTEAEQPAT